MKGPLSHALAAIVQILENPFVAVAIGLLFAAGLIAVSRRSFTRIQPDAAMVGVATAAVSLFARLAVVTLALWAYKTYAYPGFRPFAFALAGGFVVLYAVELVRYAKLQRYGRPRSARH
jgi:hypothetical protein